MKPERFQEVAALFREAGQRGPAERSAFLKEACGDDAELRAQVEVLLAADETHPGFLTESRLGERAARRAVEVLGPDAADVREHPRAIGNYRIIDVLGEGGMGVVYRAEQTEPMRRIVAVKLIKLGMDTERVVARFDAERQALALMDHPNVARVHDGGMTADGRPYFVMEYVPGIPITDYCDKERLTTRQRLDLFMQVCHGVQHAHQKGIIHRDLKPTNILVEYVDDKPTPKIIDFGVAKATAQRLTERTLFTERGQLIGTPEYMSPEQAEMSARDIDTRSDIYALGVLLYELLTGTLPFDPQTLRRAGFAEIQRIIRESPPPKPSTKLISLRSLGESRLSDAEAPTGQISAGEPSAGGGAATTAAVDIARNRHTDLRVLLQELRGDLDWIVMRCLEKDRARRYETANGLAADIERHLRHQPVEAGPPSAVYRVRKFVRRNRGLVGAAGSLAAVLILATIGMSVLAGWALRERERAEDEALNARQAEAEQTRLAQAEAVARSEAETESAKFQQIAELLEEMLSGIRPEIARDFDKRLLRLVFDDFVRELDRTPVEMVNPVVRGTLYRITGQTYLALGETESAGEMLRLAHRTLSESLGFQHEETLRAYHELGRWHLRSDQPEDAQRVFEETIELRSNSLGPDHRDTLNTVSALANLYGEMGRYDEAIPLFDRVFRQRLETLGPDAPETLTSKSSLAHMFTRKGDHGRARTMYEEVLDARMRVLGENHPQTLVTMNNLAVLLAETMQLDDAEALYRRQMELAPQVCGETHPSTLSYMHNMAAFLERRGRVGEAEALFRQTLDASIVGLGECHRDTIRTMNSLFHLLTWEQRHDEAIELGERAVSLCRQRAIEDRIFVISLKFLGMAYSFARRYDEAESYYSEALEMGRRVLPEGHQDTLGVMNNLGVLYYQTGKYDESLQLLQEVYDVQSDFLGETHRAFLTTMHNLAKARARVGDIDGALQLWNRLNELLPEVRGPRRRDIVMYLVYVPMILNELDRHEQAEPMFERALEAHRELGGELQLQMFYTMNGLAECRMRRQRFDEAAELFMEASAGRPPGSRSAGQMADRARGRAGFCYMQLGRYPEAENHLLAAAEFLSDPSVDDPELLLETQQWLIDLYTAWHEAQPDQGYDARAAEWRAKLEQASEAQDQENEPAPSGNP